MLVAVVSLLALIGLLTVITGGVIAWTARAERFRAEGYALRFLLPQNPGLTAAELGPHLRRTGDFDAWQQVAGIRVAAQSDQQLAAWTWSAGTRRPLLPGASAYQLQQAATAALAVGLLISVGIPFSVMTNHTEPYRISTATWLVVLPVAACLACSVVLEVLTWIRWRAEYRAGYATLVPAVIRRSTGDIYTGVDLVDARTGYLLRNAGALPLTSERLAARRATLRNPPREPTNQTAR
jgi:hypothetical protein